MLDPQTYRANESLARTYIPSWRISQIHNVDHFERVGFPVRVSSARELGQIVDTMQEKRFDSYMRELGGLTDNDYRLLLGACREAVEFQLSFLPHRTPVLPLSTLISCLAIYNKLRGYNPDFASVLEIGPGCGYLSFFLKHHAPLENYSQIEACESFYILQNLVNLFCFGIRFDERAIIAAEEDAVDYFTNSRPEMEFSPALRLRRPPPVCSHYPWWRIGELVSRGRKFDAVTSNANLLEFNAPALDDYLTLLHQVLKPEGIFLVQCTGFPASGTVESLFDKFWEKGFAPLMFTIEGVPATFPGESASDAVLDRLIVGGTSGPKVFTTNNVVMVKKGHPLFERYYQRGNYRKQFVAPEEIVNKMFYLRPGQRRKYTQDDFVAAVEDALSAKTPHLTVVAGALSAASGLSASALSGRSAAGS